LIEARLDERISRGRVEQRVERNERRRRRRRRRRSRGRGRERRESVQERGSG